MAIMTWPINRIHIGMEAAIMAPRFFLIVPKISRPKKATIKKWKIMEHRWRVSVSTFRKSKNQKSPKRDTGNPRHIQFIMSNPIGSENVTASHYVFYVNLKLEKSYIGKVHTFKNFASTICSVILKQTLNIRFNLLK